VYADIFKPKQLRECNTESVSVGQLLCAEAVESADRAIAKNCWADNVADIDQQADTLVPAVSRRHNHS
jgi:hypothetical protein